MKTSPLLWLLAGGCAGYVAGLIHSMPGSPAVDPSPLQQRTEEFEPDCAMLRSSSGQPRLLYQGRDYFTVLSNGEHFTVWGLNVEGQPASAWWSAKLDHAVQQACGG